MNLPKVILALQHRLSSGKQILVAKQNSHERKTLFFKFKRWCLKTFLSKDNYLKLKWRWCRGEIRARRLYIVKFKTMALPLKRFINYSEIGQKILKIQDLPSEDNFHENTSK